MNQGQDAPAGFLYAYKPGAVWSSRYPSNPRGYFDERNEMVYHLNAQGFRGRDFQPKPAGNYRFAVVGDSFMFGEGVRVEHTFAVQLEQRLAAACPEPGCDVLSADLGLRSERHFPLRVRRVWRRAPAR